MSFAKGQTLPVHRVQCSCGVPLLRKTYWRKPQCSDCRKRRAHSKYVRKVGDLRREARRYRIVLHVLGWSDDQFEEMLAEMKRSPMMFRTSPETKTGWRDWQLERRRKPASVGRCSSEGEP